MTVQYDNDVKENYLRWILFISIHQTDKLEKNRLMCVLPQGYASHNEYLFARKKVQSRRIHTQPHEHTFATSISSPEYFIFLNGFFSHSHLFYSLCSLFLSIKRAKKWRRKIVRESTHMIWKGQCNTIYEWMSM